MRRIYSSRELERACRENVCFMYLLGDYPPPDHNTIARFRSRYLVGNEQELLEQLVDMLRAWGFLSLENVFIDGTKIEANANRYSFVWKKSTAKYFQKLQEKILQELPKLVKDVGIRWHIGATVEIHRLKKLRKKLYEKAKAVGIEFLHGKGQKESSLAKGH